MCRIPLVDIEKLKNWIANFNEEAVLFDGYEEAVLGVAERCSQEPVVIYDAWKCVEILIRRDGMDPDEAMEFFQFNSLGCWAGDHTPLFLWRYDGQEDQNG